MVGFELGKEIERDVFSSCHERGTKKIDIDYVISLHRNWIFSIQIKQGSPHRNFLRQNL